MGQQMRVCVCVRIHTHQASRQRSSLARAPSSDGNGMAWLFGLLGLLLGRAWEASLVVQEVIVRAPLQITEALLTTQLWRP